jgi:hypothetical protein
VGYGIQLYPNLVSSEVYNNLVYGHGSNSGIIIQSTLGLNVVVNNTVVDNNGGITWYTPASNNILHNNIIAPGTGSCLIGTDGWEGIDVDYNILYPVTDVGAPGGLTLGTANLEVSSGVFTDRSTGSYYLSTDSVARNFGDTALMPPQDFWGIDQVDALYAGCFQYYDALVSSIPTDPWQYPNAFVDFLNPTCTILLPVNGDFVSGGISIEVSAMDDIGVASVDVLVDNILIATFTSEPYTTVFDTLPWSPCTSHTIQAISRDVFNKTNTHVISVIRRSK